MKPLRAHIDDIFGDRLAPDGSLVADNFERWFGNSKAVDAEGRPLVVYHGTTGHFDVFEPAQYGNLKGGFFFTADKPTADAFAQWRHESIGEEPVTMAVYLSINNPKVIDAAEMMQGNEHSFDAEYKAINDARAEGYDGLLVRNVPDMDRVADQWVVFRPEQIKSATDNSGLFDGSRATLGDSMPQGQVERCADQRFRDRARA